MPNRVWSVFPTLRFGIQIKLFSRPCNQGSLSRLAQTRPESRQIEISSDFKINTVWTVYYSVIKIATSSISTTILQSYHQQSIEADMVISTSARFLVLKTVQKDSNWVYISSTLGSSVRFYRGWIVLNVLYSLKNICYIRYYI